MKRVENKKYYIESFHYKFINEEYISWLNDKEINQYLEIRLVHQTQETALNYVKSFENNKNKYLWGIFSEKEFVGTVNLYNINYFHKTADISIMIGKKNHWGSAAYEALILVINYAFNDLKLRKIIAGTYANNIGMNFTLKKLGFKIEGKLIQNRKIQGNHYVDEIKWGLFKNNNKEL